MKSQYRGVTWHAGNGQWFVQLRWRGKLLALFYADAELSCAWVADFVRYMLYGSDPTKWAARNGKPNFAPCRFDGVARSEIVAILLRCRLLDASVLQERIGEYDRLIALLSKSRG